MPSTPDTTSTHSGEDAAATSTPSGEDAAATSAPSGDDAATSAPSGEDAATTGPSPMSAPDLRILQANERTLLSWVRTGLALIAFGFVVARLGMWAASAETSVVSELLGAAFIVIGAGSNAVAAVRYVRVRRALIEGRPVVPGSAAALSLALGLALLGLLLLAYVIAGGAMLS